MATAGIAALVVVLVTYQVLDRGSLVAQDSRLRVTLLHHQLAWARDLALVISTAAAVPVSVALLLVVAAGAAWRSRAWRPLILGGSATVLFAATVGTAKLLVGRARPPHPPTELFVAGSSFPSGHTAADVVLLGFALLLVGPRLTRHVRWSLRILAALIAFSVGLSRVYLDQHWLSDVLASWALGVLIVSVVAALPRGAREWSGARRPRHEGAQGPGPAGQSAHAHERASTSCSGQV